MGFEGDDCGVEGALLGVEGEFVFGEEDFVEVSSALVEDEDVGDVFEAQVGGGEGGGEEFEGEEAFEGVEEHYGWDYY